MDNVNPVIAKNRIQALYYTLSFAGLAQLVERLLAKQKVASSNLVSRSIIMEGFLSQFHLTVYNGISQKEEGFFFRAAPFIVEIESSRFLVSFSRIFKSEDHHPVVYQVFQKDNCLFALEHPDYAPPGSVEEFEKQYAFPELKPLFLALIKLGIIKDKDYIQAYSSLPLSFSVIQDSFLSV